MMIKITMQENSNIYNCYSNSNCKQENTMKESIMSSDNEPNFYIQGIAIENLRLRGSGLSECDSNSLTRPLSVRSP